MLSSSHLKLRDLNVTNYVNSFDKNKKIQPLFLNYN